MMRFMLIAICCAIVLSSCDDKVYYEENTAIADATWSVKEPKIFEFDIQDTLQLYNFYVNVRNDESYAYSNLFLFVEMEFPNGKKSIDTLECPLADPYGNWYGSGLGKIYDQRIVFRERKKFPLSGHYKVGIFQAMREDNLQGIHDIGFRVARVN